MVYLMVHFVVVVVVDIEVFFGIDYPVLGTKVFSGTSFLILSIMVFFGIDFALSIEPFLDIISFTLLKHIVASFDITIKQVLNSKVSFDILDLLID